MSSPRAAPGIASWLSLLCVVAVAGCTQPRSDIAGTYGCVLQLPGGSVPFGLSIEEHDGARSAWIFNGEERIRVPELALRNGNLTLLMPGFEHRIDARVTRRRLVGELRLVKRAGELQIIPFTAVRGASYQFFDTPSDGAASIAGRWATTFTDEDGVRTEAVGEFTQQGNAVSGTFLTPTGDHRYLSGQVRGRELYLGKFDGAQAYLYRATLGARGELSGDYWSGLKSHERFVARRDDNASLGAAEQATILRNSAAVFDFSFPDLQGRVVSLHDAAFAGKVVVVTLAGSWCPNCHDEAAFLSPYYKEYHAAGLEMIGLMFEQFDGYAQAAAAVRRFAAKFDIRYPLLIAGVTGDDDASSKLPQLNRVVAYPTTLFIDRKGKLRRIHTGFSGPATGEHYTRLTRDFDATIKALLEE